MTPQRGLLLTLILLACDPGSPGSFPPEDPALAQDNERAGDPHRGRFPFAEAVAGLPESGPLHATIVTDEGEIHCRLFADVAPLSVANFVGLARGLRPFFDPATGAWTTRPYYDGLSFHRAIERQFVQGGRLDDSGSVGFRLQDEISIGSAFDKPGVLALANEGRANSGAAEFFISTAVLRELDGKYTIIGRCDDELIVRAIEARVLAGERPVIETVTITRE
ncbi:MAG TPA: peptidylprolyl isomerase [Enhygromyxa sp.]|nr:peptidylprolyl isomerase [Enhygromyxa sp.]